MPNVGGIACSVDPALSAKLGAIYEQIFSNLPLIALALAIAVALFTVYTEYRAGTDAAHRHKLSFYTTVALAPITVWAVTDYIHDHNLKHQSFPAFFFALLCECVALTLCPDHPHKPAPPPPATAAPTGASAASEAKPAAGEGGAAAAAAPASLEPASPPFLDKLKAVRDSAVVFAGAAVAAAPRFVDSFIFLAVVIATLLFLWKEQVLSETISHLVSFIPDAYFTRFLAFPSLALFAYEMDSKMTVVSGSPLVQLGETILLIKLYQHSFEYLANLVRFVTGLRLDFFHGEERFRLDTNGGASKSAILGNILDDWFQIAWMSYVLGFMPDTRVKDAPYHDSLVYAHNLITILYAATVICETQSRNVYLQAAVRPFAQISQGYHDISEALRNGCADAWAKLQSMLPTAIRG